MSDDDERVTDSEQGWSEKDQGWEEDSEKGTEGEVGDSCELAPHSAMSVGAGRVDSPSPQDIRLLHDLVEDLTKEQEEKIRPRAEQVSQLSRWFRKINNNVSLPFIGEDRIEILFHEEEFSNHVNESYIFV